MKQRAVCTIMCAAVTGLSAGLQAQQTISVKGSVHDNAGVEIIGASILEKGTANGTITDYNGEFTLPVTVGKTLVISYVGYLTKEVVAAPNLNIVLEEDTKELSEIIVVGYGIQQKANLSGAVTQIDSKALAGRPIQNVSSGMQGLMPGVTVLSGQGRPGQDGGTIRIRGVGTLNTADPYILIDGVESGTMNSLNPDDIESISVLKDASSAAIYGSKASNGVVLITTKRGKTGKPRISYSGYAGTQTPTQTIERLSSADYASLLNQALVENGKTPRFSDEDIALFADGSDPYGYPNTDWYDLAFKTGFQQQHSVSANGGNETASYMASVGYLQQNGILPHATRNQVSARSNLDLKINSRLNVKLNLAFIRNNYSDPNNSYVGGGSDQIIRQLNIVAPWIAYLNEDGSYGTVSDGNPVAWLDLDQTIDRENRNFTGLVSADYTLFDGLKATLQGSYVNNIQHLKEFRKSIQYNPSKFHGPNRLDEKFYLWDRTQFDAFLNYDKKFGFHGLKALLGWHTEDYNYSETTAYRSGFPNNELTDLNAGTASTQQNTGYSRRLTMVSGFGRINYDYAGRYLFEGNFRADASSRFHPDERWGLFPSFSAAWRLSEEAFMEDIDIENLKIRASWGLLGNQAALDDYYPYLNTYNLDGSYPFGGALAAGYYQKKYRIETITWEKARTYGIGVDASLHHVSLSVDFYDRKTTGIIMDVPVPSEFALDPYKDNVGAMLNRGVELSLGYNNRWEDFSLSLAGNISYNRNKILDLGGVDNMADPDNGNKRHQIGEAIGSYYMYEADGFFQSQEEADVYMEQYKSQAGYPFGTRPFKAGDIKYADTNGDGKISSDDRVICNSSNPAYVFGASVNAGYRCFDLALIFSGAAKVARLYNNEAFGDFSGDASHPSTIWLDAWTPNNTDAKMPRISEARSSNSHPQNVMSTFWLQNTSYVRLKNVQLGYTVPPTLLKGAGIANLRVYYSAENVFTIDTLPINIDPESPVERGSGFPLVQTHTIGLNITF